MNAWMDVAFTKHYPGISIRGEWTWVDRPRRITALFGPSGCGKTTILRCLAGLERPDVGHIRAFGEDWCDVSRRIHVKPQQRRIGLLFQDYLLFPHLTVRDNIEFGRPPHAPQDSSVDQLIERFRLGGLENRLPHQLSGGQQQRVALARVLAAQPRLICLDEPLSALDGPTRAELRISLRHWLHELQLPALIVSHDIVEVQTLADDVVVLDNGSARQSGSVADVWHHPVDETVARIVGFENLLPVTVTQANGLELEVEQTGWMIRGESQTPLQHGQAAIACIRAEDLRCVPLNSREQRPVHGSATVQEIIPEGGRWRLRLLMPSGFALQAVVSGDVLRSHNLNCGVTIGLEVAAGAAAIVPKSTT